MPNAAERGEKKGERGHSVSRRGECRKENDQTQLGFSRRVKNLISSATKRGKISRGRKEKEGGDCYSGLKKRHRLWGLFPRPKGRRMTLRQTKMPCKWNLARIRKKFVATGANFYFLGVSRGDLTGRRGHRKKRGTCS